MISATNYDVALQLYIIPAIDTKHKFNLQTIQIFIKFNFDGYIHMLSVKIKGRVRKHEFKQSLVQSYPHCTF